MTSPTATTSDPAQPPARSLRARYVLVGLGGIGAQVLRLLVPFVHSRSAQATVVAADGDVFEHANRGRMLFDRPGPKAEVLCEELADYYGEGVNLVPVCEYITADNVGDLIGEGEVVFCQPDNHATRRIIEQRCGTLDDVVLISGGNDGVEAGSTGTYGNVQIYLRRNGQDLTNTISRFHPEIANPSDHLPTEVGCGAAAVSAPQLLFTNATVAAAMVCAFYALLSDALDYEELYFDTLLGRMVPVTRPLAS